MKPLKRHDSLKPLSREHHHGLLFCWKVRKGLKNNVELERIKQYRDFFFSRHLKQHFKKEEKYLFPLLSDNHPLIKKALKQHKKLNKLFNEREELLKALSGIEELLDEHIRFEERELFIVIQQEVGAENLTAIEEQIDQPTGDIDKGWEDKFWE